MPEESSKPSSSRYTAELPLPEELQALLGSAHVIESFLGQGGMGAVYRGLQMPLRRPVAIKVLTKRGAGTEDDFAFEERFKREAYAMAALTHPHIVQVYDCGDAGEHFLFISMELVEGGDLSNAIKEGRVTPEVALKLILQICDGLQYAHEHGLVHRDIKPANIFLTADGRAKVADFGLAKKFDSQSTFATKTGMSMGTPDYAAPEQFDGLPDIDHRADIYSLGVMAYQMLTGTLPRGNYRPASQRAGTDPRLDAVLGKAMEHGRADRYQSVAEMKADILAITSPAPRTGVSRVEAVPVVPRTPTPAARPAASGPRRIAPPTSRPATPAPVKQGGANAALVTLGILAALAAGVWFLFLKPKPEPAAAGDAFMREVAALPPDEQVKRVMEELKKLNPGFNPVTALANKEVTDGKVTLLKLLAVDATDVSPLRALTALEVLTIEGTSTSTPNPRQSPVKDISPLRGLPLKKLILYNTKVSDLTPLKGMKLNEFNGNINPFEDLSPLAGMPISVLSVYQTRVSDLSPLRGMNVKNLILDNCPVRDLSPLAGMMSLERLSIKDCPVGDITVLRSLKLRDLLVSDKTTGLDGLRGLGVPWKINGKPANEWIGSSTPPSTDATTPPAQQLTFNGHRYQFFPDKLSWTEAKAKAESMGGHLATITSKEENEWIAETFASAASERHNIWLGASSPHGLNKSLWKWVTGEPMAFQAWKPNRPQNAGAQAMMFSVSKTSGFGWTDMSYSGVGVSDWRGGYLVEWDDDGKSTPATTTRELPADGSWLDVIPLVQLPQDVSQADPKWKTDWRIAKDALTAAYSGNATIISPQLALPDSYDLTLRVKAATEEGTVAVHVPVGASRHMTVLLKLVNRSGRNLTGLEKVKGNNVDKGSPVVNPSVIGNDTEHLVEIAVRRDATVAGVDLKVDGKPVLRWFGPEDDLSLHNTWKRMKPRQLGLTGSYVRLTWRDVRVRRVEGAAQR